MLHSKSSVVECFPWTQPQWRLEMEASATCHCQPTGASSLTVTSSPRNSEKLERRDLCQVRVLVLYVMCIHCHIHDIVYMYKHTIEEVAWITLCICVLLPRVSNITCGWFVYSVCVCVCVSNVRVGVSVCMCVCVQCMSLCVRVRVCVCVCVSMCS